MTFVVPFDGSELAVAALTRAGAFATVFDEDVLAVTVIPQRNDEYAAERGWIDRDDPFDLETICEGLRDDVAACCPGATFRHEVVDRYAPVGTIKNRIRRVIREVDASMVFIGSENAGRVVTALGSVGGGIVTGEDYDVVIVRTSRPTKIEALQEAAATPIEDDEDRSE